jgi:myosin heavy subunit
MSKIPYLHIITGIAAASVAFLPQRSLNTAIAVGLVAGAGSAVAQKVTQRSLGDLSQTIRQSHPNPELKDDSNLLKHYQERLKDINSALETSRAEQQRLSRLVQEQEQHISEKEGALQASLAEQQRLSHQIQNYQRQVAQNQGSLKSALAEADKLSQQLEKSEQRVSEQNQDLEKYKHREETLREQLNLIQERVIILESDLEKKSQIVSETQGSLKSALAEQDRLTQLLQEAEQKIREQDQMCEDEIKTLQDQIAGYQASLESVVQTATRRNYEQVNHNTKNLLQSGLVLAMTECDLYPGEIKSFIMNILSHKKNSVHPNSRIYHILDDLVRNNDYTNGEEFRDQLETCLYDLFRDYQRWNPSMENELSRLHFDVVSMNDHIKIRFCNDNRYTISFSGTPGDWRVGLNIIRDIRNTIFGLPE